MKKNIKKLAAGIAAVMMTVGAAGAAHAAWNEVVSMTIDEPVMTVRGEKIEIDTPPTIINDRTFLPVRAVAEAVGGTVDWDGETRTVTVDHNNTKLRLTIDSTTVYQDGYPEEMDVAPVIVNDRTMLPIRYVAAGLGLEVDWNEETRTVTLSEYEFSESHKGQDGNTYTEYIGHYDATAPDGSLIQAFEDISTIDFRYLASDGKLYNVREIEIDTDPYFAYIVTTPDGTKVNTDTVYDPDKNSLVGKASDGSVYTGLGNDVLTVTFPDGTFDVLGKLREVRYVFHDDKGQEAYEICHIDETPDDGFLYPDGTFVMYDRDYYLKYTMEDGRIYAFVNGFLVELDNDGKPLMEAADTGTVVSLYDSPDGTGYYVSTSETNGSLLFADNTGKEFLLKFVESKVLDSENEYSDMDFYYEDEEGNRYVEHSTDSDIYAVNADGSETKSFILNGFAAVYQEGSKGTYLVRYLDDKTEIVLPDGKTYTVSSEDQ